MIILHFLLSLVNNLQITQPQVKFYQDTLPPAIYWTTLGQEQIISFPTHPTVYQMQIQQQVQDEQEYYFNDYDLHYYHNDGCDIQQQTLTYAFLNQTSEIENDSHYLDMILQIPEQLAITVSNDYIISIFNLSSGNINNQYNATENITTPTMLGQIYLINGQNSNSYFAINEHLSIYFELDANNTIQNVQQANLNSTKIGFIKRMDSKISNMLYIACDLGIDIYSIDENNLTYINTLGADLFGRKPKILDLDFDSTSNYLIVLDSQIGVQFIKIDGIMNSLLPWSISISNGISISVAGQTLFIIAQYLNQYFAAEIFFDISQQTYYFNRFYNEQMYLQDIYLSPNFAIIQGVDQHLLAYHSIYNGFVDNKHQQIHEFQEPFLMKIQSLTQNTFQNATYFDFVALTAYNLVRFQIIQNIPTVTCTASHYFNKNYTLMMNSTECFDKTIKNDKSQFSQCQVLHSFKFEAFDDYLDSSELWILLALGICLAILILSLSIGGIVCWRKWGRHLKDLEWKSRKLREQQYAQMEKEQEA